MRPTVLTISIVKYTIVKFDIPTPFSILYSPNPTMQNQSTIKAESNKTINSTCFQQYL